MPIYQTAHYRVNPGAVGNVKAAIAEFVAYVTEHEPGTRNYTAWKQQRDPTKFVLLFDFADETAHQAHGASAAVRKFEEVDQPELAAPSPSPTTARSSPTTAGRFPTCQTRSPNRSRHAPSQARRQIGPPARPGRFRAQRPGSVVNRVVAGAGVSGGLVPSGLACWAS